MNGDITRVEIYEDGEREPIVVFNPGVTHDESVPGEFTFVWGSSIFEVEE